MLSYPAGAVSSNPPDQQSVSQGFSSHWFAHIDAARVTSWQQFMDKRMTQPFSAGMMLGNDEPCRIMTDWYEAKQFTKNVSR